MYLCMGQGGTEVCACVWVRKDMTCVQVYGSGRHSGVYMCVGQGLTEVCTSVWVREELRYVHICGSGRN